jgi:phage replication O-like protein O
VLSLADVQLENGYTKIANKILERLALTKLSPIQFRLILVIWRYTYGFNRKEHTFSLSFLSEATNYDQRQLQRELAKLEQRRIIIQKVQPGKPRIISFNKNYDEWLDEETLGNSTIGKVTNGNSTKGTFGNSTEGTLGNSTKEEIKNINKNLNKNNDDDNKDQPKENVVNAFRFYEENFYPVLSSVDIEVLNYWLDRFPEEIVVYAMKKSLKQNVRNLAYVEKILINWEQNKVKSLEDVERLDRQHELDKLKKRNSYVEGGQKYRKPVRTEAIPEWLKNISYDTPRDDDEEDIEKKRQELAERLKKYKDEEGANNVLI